MGSGGCGDHQPQETNFPFWTCGLCVQDSKNPSTSASGYTAEPRREGELPPGGYIFQWGEKNKLNYISKRYRHAEEEYQKRLGPGAEMPKMRIWKAVKG